MTMNTIFGPAIGDGVAFQTTVKQGEWGPLVEKRWWQNPLHEVRTRQATRIPVHINHSKALPVGEIVHLEIAGNPERLWAVAHVDERIRLPEDEDTFWSVETLSDEGTGADVEITGLGLVAKSAQLGLRPVRLLEGDLAYRGASSRWTGLSQFERGLFERAEQARFEQRSGAPILVRHAARDEHTGHTSGGGVTPAERLIAMTLHHDLQLEQYDEAWQHRPLRIRPCGPILNVR